MTYRGKAVARIVPVHSPDDILEGERADVWKGIDSLASQTRRFSTEDAPAREKRRELASASLESLVEHIRENGARQRAEAHAHFENVRGAFTEVEWRCEAKSINAEGDRIASEIGEHSTGPVSAVEIVRGGRRDFGRVRD